MEIIKFIWGNMIWISLIFAGLVISFRLYSLKKHGSLFVEKDTDSKKKKKSKKTKKEVK